jgi:hypothetical protein
MRFESARAPVRRKKWIPAENRTAVERAWRFVIWRHRSNFSADMWLGKIGT